MAPYNIDADSVNELKTLRLELDAQLQAPRNAIIDRKTSTARLSTLMRELDALVKLQLDKLMILLADAHREFFHEYQNARVIVDLRPRRGAGPERDDGTPREPDVPDGGFAME